ncbi:family 16 glycosylhydrolase, partial [Corynebacterium mendelii]
MKGTDYELVWSSEFNDGFLGEDWRLDDKPVENGNMCYTNTVGDDGTIQVKDGFLRLRAKPATAPKPMCSTESGGIKTVGKKYWRYGYIETRLRLQDAPGTWPALWMVPEAGTRGWPIDGEIDWIEYVPSNRRDSMQTSIHMSNVKSRRGRNDTALTAFANGVDDISNEWHVWGMKWDPSGFEFYLDGVKYGHVKSTGSAPSEGELRSGNIIAGNHGWPFTYDNGDGGVVGKIAPDDPFNVDFHLIFNMGTRKPGQWGGSNQPYDFSRSHVDMDYVRVFQTSEQRKAQNKVTVNFQPFAQATVDTPVTRTYDRGAKIGVTPIYEGKGKYSGQYSFAWSRRLKPDKTIPSWAVLNEDSPVKFDYTLHPVWSKGYKLTLETNGGTLPDNASQEIMQASSDASIRLVREDASDKTVELPTPTPPTGKTFAGWFLDGSLSQEAGTSVELTGDKTVYAKWEKASPTTTVTPVTTATVTATTTSTVRTETTTTETVTTPTTTV